MDEKAEALIKRIRVTFKDVTLENGVGLFEAQGLDEYKTPEECLELRQKDAKSNWEAISVADLNQCYSSLSFFDPKGMRFHLPAFLIADIQDKYKFDLVFTLAHLNDYSRFQFSVLSLEQRRAVRAYLSYIRDTERYALDRSQIDFSLKEYWTDEELCVANQEYD